MEDRYLIRIYEARAKIKHKIDNRCRATYLESDTPFPIHISLSTAFRVSVIRPRTLIHPYSFYCTGSTIARSLVYTPNNSLLLEIQTPELHSGDQHPLGASTISKPSYLHVANPSHLIFAFPLLNYISQHYQFKMGRAKKTRKFAQVPNEAHNIGLDASS